MALDNLLTGVGDQLVAVFTHVTDVGYNLVADDAVIVAVVVGDDATRGLVRV
jgi:hypothetical protein